MSEYIYVTAVIDAKSLYQDFKNESPSKDPTEPTQINNAYGYFITALNTVHTDTQTTPDKVIKVKTGDTVRFSVTSDQNNFEHVVVLCEISKSQCWTTPKFVSEKRRMVFPSNLKFTDFTTHLRKYEFVSVNFIEAGIEMYTLKFILYERVSDDNKPFKIFGYFEYETTAHIN